MKSLFCCLLLLQILETFICFFLENLSKEMISFLISSRFAKDKEGQKRILTLDERIEMSRKDMNKKALHEFMTIGWLHPKFRDL